jgi:hypothetical protein
VSLSLFFLFIYSYVHTLFGPFLSVSLDLLPGCVEHLCSTMPTLPRWTETSETVSKTNPSSLKLFLSGVLS